jgi:UPF0716 protein FxsA
VAQNTHPGILVRVRPVPLLFSLFLLTPIVEVVLFILIGSRIGLVATIGLVILTAAIGAVLVSRQGRAAFFQARNELLEGRFPAGPLAHGVTILVAGALLLTPGFLTDGIGFALLVPGVRKALHRRVARRYRPDQIYTL